MDSIRKYREHVLGFVECLEALGRRTRLHAVRRAKQAGRFRPGDRVIAFAPRHLECAERSDGVLYVAVNSEPDVDLPADVRQTRYRESRRRRDRRRGPAAVRVRLARRHLRRRGPGARYPRRAAACPP
ncbi:MAG: hypothetical protein JXB13_03540 [Phycisphaerae bacterium]|nr:hypothetical protein [Phycisphaerae bacterium]